MTPQEFIDRVFQQSGAVPAPRVAVYGEVVSQHLVVGHDNLWSPDTRQIAFLPQLIDLFEEARRIRGQAIPVSAGFRTVAHEEDLERRGYKTAKFVSPHSVGAALDCDARPTSTDSESKVNVAIRTALGIAAKNLGLPRPRLGHTSYRERFTHVDLVFMLFEPHTSLPHPKDWTDLPAAWRNYAAVNWQPGVEW